MRRILSLFIIFITYSSSYAQNEEYVISKPSKPFQINPKPLYKIDNPDFTNYFLTPSAFTLKKDNIRLSNTDIVFIKASHGLTDNTMISINTSLFGMLTASVKHQIELSASLSIAGSLSLGVLASNGKDSSIFLGGSTFVGTYGDYQNNVSAGVGFYYAQSTFDIINDDSNVSLYHAFIGIQKQVSRRLYLLLDGMYFFDYRFYTGGIGLKYIISDFISIGAGVMPLAINQATSARSNTIDGGVIPILSFRMLLNRN